jgi:hypothetical protein
VLHQAKQQTVQERQEVPFYRFFEETFERRPPSAYLVIFIFMAAIFASRKKPAFWNNKNYTLSTSLTNICSEATSTNSATWSSYTHTATSARNTSSTTTNSKSTSI